jgi:phage baseplate assembly protein gpV
MSRVTQLMGSVARHQAQARATCELGTVVAVVDGSDPDLGHSVDVRLKDSAVDLPKVPMASGASGMALLPRVGDIVLVLFPRGDLGSAIAIGQIYSGDRRPPQFTRDQAMFRFPGDKAASEEDCIELKLDVTQGRTLTIALGGSRDTRLVMTDGEISLISGKVQVVMKEQDSSVSVTVGDGTLKMQDGGGVTLESAGKLTLKASEIALEADAKVTVKGAMVELN